MITGEQARVPTSQAQDVRLALAAERDLPRKRDEPLATWLEHSRSRSADTLCVDEYGRLSLNSSVNSPPVELAEEIVSPAWRQRYHEGLRHFADIGRALRALESSPRHARSPMGLMLSLVRTATGLGRFRVLQDRHGVTTGFFIWLHLSGRTVDRLRRHPFAPLHPSEWNEGVHLRIRDASFLASGMVAWVNWQVSRRDSDD